MAKYDRNWWPEQLAREMRERYSSHHAWWEQVMTLIEADFSQAIEVWPWDLCAVARGRTDLVYHTGLTREVRHG